MDVKSIKNFEAYSAGTWWYAEAVSLFERSH